MEKIRFKGYRKINLMAIGCGLLLSVQMRGQDDHHDHHGSVADTAKITEKPVNKDGFKINFNDAGTNYARINFVSQMWVMDNQNNPGSTAFGSAAPMGYMVGLRRTRLTLSSQVTDKVFIFGQIGSDGISTLSTGRSLPLQFLDMTVDYKILGKWLTLGAGLHGWDGLGRWSNPSVPTVMGLDMPLYQQATVNITDNTVRMPGVYAKGFLGKLDYRVSASIPYPTTTNTLIAQSATVTAANANPQWNASTFAGNQVQPQLQGYFRYQFFDMESNLSPGTIGSYLGKKSVFNIGAGVRYQQNAMWHADYNQGANTAGTQTLTIKDTARTNMLLWQVEMFYDCPINKDKGTAITAYASYSYFDFGQNYLRNANPLNPATGAYGNPANGSLTNPTGGFNPALSSFNGGGNQFPMIGTGATYFGQVGYLMKKFKDGTQFQPYAMYQYSAWQGLKDPVILWNLGVNYLIKGHNSKVSLDYQSRPIFNYSTADNQLHDIKSARRGMIVLQYQIAF